MKYITVKLTEDQINETILALGLNKNAEFPSSDPQNRFIQRIIDKLEKSKNL